MNLVDELFSIARALHGAKITYAVCGGIAVTIHGATRTTQDIDILLLRADLSRALDVVRPLGYLYAAVPMTFDTGTAQERCVQRVTKLEGEHHLVLDLILAEAALSAALDDRVELDLPEGTLTVVSREALLAMKRLAGRAQDQADIEKLGGSE